MGVAYFASIMGVAFIILVKHVRAIYKDYTIMIMTLYMGLYIPPISFRARSLDKTHQVVQNRTMGMSKYIPCPILYPSSNFFEQFKTNEESDVSGRFSKITVLKN